MTKISSRQLFFFLAAIAPVGKLIYLPTQLAEFSANDLLFPAAVNFFLQAGAVFFILLLSRSNKTLYDLLSYTFGKIAAKIILSVFTLFLFYAAVIPIMEQKFFVHFAFYDTLPTVFAFAPFFLLSVYLCAKPLVHAGRIWDILAPVAMVGFAGIIIFSFGEADFAALAPVGAKGADGFLRGTAFTMGWFYDSAILLLLMGKFDYEKGMAWKGALCYLAGAAAILLFLAVFYGIFSDIAVRQIFAFAKVSKYFVGIPLLGRIDYIFIYAVALVMAFYNILPLHAGVDSLTHAFAKRQTRLFSALCSIAVNAVIFSVTLLLNFSFRGFLKIVTQTAFWVFPLFCLLLPALALLLRRSPREKV